MPISVGCRVLHVPGINRCPSPCHRPCPCPCSSTAAVSVSCSTPQSAGNRELYVRIVRHEYEVRAPGRRVKAGPWHPYSQLTAPSSMIMITFPQISWAHHSFKFDPFCVGRGRNTFVLRHSKLWENYANAAAASLICSFAFASALFTELASHRWSRGLDYAGHTAAGSQFQDLGQVMRWSM